MLLATFIFHEKWAISTIPPTCPLAQYLYFVFCCHYPNHFSFVKISLLWQNDPDSPVITRIPICSLLNRLMEVHIMRKNLPDQMMNMIIKELDKRNMGEGSFNASHIIQSIEE